MFYISSEVVVRKDKANEKCMYFSFELHRKFYFIK